MKEIEWIEHSCKTKERKVMLEDEINIPGIRLFGSHNTSKAISALNPHYHKNCFELTYIVKGTASFGVNNQIYNLSGGDLFLTNMNEIHHTDNKPLPLHKMYWLQIDGSDPDNFLYLQRNEALRLIKKLSALNMYVVKMDSTVANTLLEAIFNLLDSNSLDNKREVAALINLFLYRVIHNANSVKFCLTPDIGRCVNYILDNIDQELSMDTLANISYLSVSRFKQKFKEQIGMTPREFINAEKIRNAKTMLTEGMNVTDIAMELGFSSSNYFSVVFKQFTSFSPTDFAKKATQNQSANN